MSPKDTPASMPAENIVLDAKNNPKIKTLFEKLIYIWNTKYENFFFEATSVFFLLLKELQLLCNVFGLGKIFAFQKPQLLQQKKKYRCGFEKEVFVFCVPNINQLFK